MDVFTATAYRGIASSNPSFSDEDWVLLLRLVLHLQMGGNLLFAFVAKPAQDTAVNEVLPFSHLRSGRTDSRSAINGLDYRVKAEFVKDSLGLTDASVNWIFLQKNTAGFSERKETLRLKKGAAQESYLATQSESENRPECHHLPNVLPKPRILASAES
ncbi:MAG: hypothetical protein KGI38_03670 [Thaumarchaeota archaeon]|nr:hypothetical protein [Nitrososphaerota archaeon]